MEMDLVRICKIENNQIKVKNVAVRGKASRILTMISKLKIFSASKNEKKKEMKLLIFQHFFSFISSPRFDFLRHPRVISTDFLMGKIFHFFREWSLELCKIQDKGFYR